MKYSDAFRNVKHGDRILYIYLKNAYLFYHLYYIYLKGSNP
nr:MAG TPA: hypothetical protein [Caudoviricetes sp.]